jgi:acetyl-CoA synthetase
LPQRPETAIAHIACYRLGAIALPISKLFGTDALRYRLTNSSARVLMLEPESLEKIEPIRNELPDLKHVIIAGGKKGGLGFDDLVGQASDNFTTPKSNA